MWAPTTGARFKPCASPKYDFDRIFCFEPASFCWPALEAIRDDRVRVCKFGLWNTTCEQALYAQ